MPKMKTKAAAKKRFKITGTGKVLTKICPAHVYREEADGTISVEFAACLECGLCFQMAAPG